jgi:hypothetical protein
VCGIRSIHRMPCQQKVDARDLDFRPRGSRRAPALERRVQHFRRLDSAKPWIEIEPCHSFVPNKIALLGKCHCKYLADVRFKSRRI